MRRKKLILLAPLAILGLLLFVFIGGEVVKQLWNWLLPPLFGWRQLTFWQALGLLALVPHPLRRVRARRSLSFQHSSPHVRAMGEHEPRGTRTASTGHASDAADSAHSPARAKGRRSRRDRYETAASRMASNPITPEERRAIALHGGRAEAEIAFTILFKCRHLVPATRISFSTIPFYYSLSAPHIKFFMYQDCSRLTGPTRRAPSPITG